MSLADPIETLITILILQQITGDNGFDFGSYSRRQKDSSRGSNPSRRKNDSKKKNLSDYIIVHDHRLNDDELQEKVELQREMGQLKKKLPLINGVACQLEDEDHLAEVESMPGVKRVDEDLTLEIKLSDYELESEQSLSGDFIPWGIEEINASDAWSELKAKVGIIDTGIDLNHFDLSPINSGYNPISSGQQPEDQNGHGTHVAGTIAARKNGKGIVGVAPNIKLYPVKAFDKDGSAKISSLIEALQWSIDNDLQVLNMSFGVDRDNDTLREAIAKTYEAGITMVAASGNDGATTVDFPARYPEVIAVGAVNEDKQLANFSNYGSNLDVVAPGVDVESTWKNGQFNKLDGTSMAAPHVTGITALILGKFDNLTPAEIKEAIKEGATLLDSIDSAKQGAGLVNAAETIELLKK